MSETVFDRLPTKLNRRLFPWCRSISAGVTVTLGLMAFSSSLHGEETRVAKPSDCMPAVTDYAYMWWAHGWRSPDKVLAIQTGHYGLAIDVRKAEVLHLGAIAKPLPAEQAVAQGNEVVFSLPPPRVRLEVIVAGTTRLAWWRFLAAISLSNLGIASAYAALGDSVGWPVALMASISLPLFAGGIARVLWPKTAQRPFITDP